MVSKYNDPAYITARVWESVEELIGLDERATLLTELGFDEQQARADRFKGLALLSAWRCAFAERVRSTYQLGIPCTRSEAVVRSIELALELNLGRARFTLTVPVRLRFGIKHRGRWSCELYADSNTDPKRPWRTEWRFPHEYCFIDVDDSGHKLSWTAGFTHSPIEDAQRFVASVPSVGVIHKSFDARYCLWLEGLRRHARQGRVPAFYWPGYDGTPLLMTRLFDGGANAYPLPRSPWG